MTVRPIDANIAMKKIREYMEDFPNASTRLATCRSILSMLEDENQIPTLTPPNELLTLDQLREMDGEPVWVELYRAWALVEVKQNGSIMFYGNSFSCPYSRTWKVYRFRPDRRQPEGEEGDANRG